MSAPEPLVLQALQGYTEQSDKWPGPRVVKIFVASVYNDFREERRHVLELAGPELQATYDDRHVEFEFVDMHYGTDGGDETNPALLRYHLEEIRSCNHASKAGYFLCFIGGDTSTYQPVLPFKIAGETFEQLIKSESAQTALIRACYRLNGDGNYHLEGDEKWFSDLLDRDEQRKRLSIVQKVFNTLALEALEKGADVTNLLRSPVEIQCDTALELLSTGKHPKGLIVVYRDIPDLEADDSKLTTLVHQRLKKLLKKFEDVLPETHVIRLEAISADSSRTDAASDNEEKLSPFREKVQAVVSSLVDDSLSTEPDQGKGRKKTVQEVFLEHITHLRICIEHNRLYKVNVKKIEDAARDILDNAKENYENRCRHPPVLIYGPDASGKSTLLTHLYFKCEEIFPKPVLRIIRFSAATPRSAYNLELLRVMCQQISIILNIPEGYLPKDASFDPLYINNWFQSLLKRCEEMKDEILLIFIDNVHRVNPLECDIVTGLSWLPMSLPRNVFLFCTSAMSLEQLQLTPAQKEKFKVQNCYYLLDAVEESPENNSCGDYIDGAFDNLEVVFGSKSFSKLAGYITCSEFGLTELELLELLMPTSNSDAVITLKDANFNFSTLCVAKYMMLTKTIIVENVVSGRSTWRWRAAAASARARRRYVRVQSALRDAHSDLAALHFANFLNDTDDTDTSETHEPVLPGYVDDDDALLDSTPFHSASRTAAAFTQRHVEESWLHLLLAGDFSKLKDLTVCNFDFLLAAVQTVTISYLRCILEHVRCYILDRDVELVYGAVRKSSDILTRDPMQLGAQIIAWLRPAVARRGVLATLVTAAMAWCDGYDKPLLVPLNGWLHPPIASTVRVVSVGGSTPGAGVRLLQLAPSGQHLVLAPSAGDPQLWHVMSNSKVHTFKGHSGRILCMCVTRESQYLLTGSEDTSVIVWDLHTLAVKTKILEHIAPVLCVAAIVNRSLVISGGEDSAVIVTSLVDGALVTKLDHHRGPVTTIKVIQDGDILVTCSQDGTVCTWNVDSFTLLSTVSTGVPIHAMEVTEDNVFLVTLQGENELHIRTFITGTHLHILKRHKAKVKCFCVGHDSSRVSVGCADQRIYIYSLHTAQLLRTLAAAHDLAALAIADKDHFLLAAGGNRVTIYSFHTEDNLTNFRPTKMLKRRQTKSTTNITLLQAEQSELIPISCLEVSRDGQLAASGCARGLVRVWQLSTHRLQTTLNGHLGHITCVTFSPNNLLVLSGSEDRTVVVWQLADNSSSLTYKGHQSALQTLLMMSDGRRAMSGDRARNVHVWLVDSGIVLHSATCPTASIDVTLNMKFAVLSDGDNSVRIWALAEGDSGEEKRSVSHAERVTCFALTADSQHVVTGSMDMSLKVWQLDGGKLSQVLVGHSDIVTCVAVSITNKTQVVSGSWDYNLIVWDINTGSDVHLLSGHLGKVTCVKVTGDGSIAVSGAEDKTLIIWETKRGLALTSFALHVPLLGFQITSDCSRVVVHLLDRGCLPIICLHNTPATYVKIPTYAAPTKDVDELRPLAPKRPMRRLLKKEVSLDTYTWQKKYGHLTSAAMMAQVDERLKRRFSVSASMEEISKIQEAKNKDLGSQVSLGPEQAAIAQSQHFDQLEALWNKISPPRRRSNKSLSKQSSLIERVDSSDEDHTPVEEQEHMVE
ncbi:protein qui-1 isoform X1 [Maniola jurtina]|uniref:protein qui-1 isoform X1 n=2 Tax=Maniola jurtina TaxID=191418 RepID=UPI001E6890C2|nr:protein qui-1 isoform X1 [Maniola jurtina]XP_045764511.1 protein qui-1 isoform X1 [Maniola jurtina]XP_045764512.1 protein qui-1 isoform X1 [Maniola jurtina]